VTNGLVGGLYNRKLSLEMFWLSGYEQSLAPRPPGRVVPTPAIGLVLLLDTAVTLCGIASCPGVVVVVLRVAREQQSGKPGTKAQYSGGVILPDPRFHDTKGDADLPHGQFFVAS
jgi:hypothetical protein